MRRAFLAALVFGFAAPAWAGDINVALDEVHTVTFPAPVATVYVGNPSIADINMIDARHAFVLGKAYGNTNVVALNREGQQIADTRVNVLVNVQGGRQATVTLQRGIQRSTYDCTETHCELTPRLGDSKEAFDQANGQIASHQATARKAAGE